MALQTKSLLKVLKSLRLKVHRLGSAARVCALLCSCSQAAVGQNMPDSAHSSPSAGVHWQLGQSQTVVAIALPVNKTALGMTLRVKVDALDTTGFINGNAANKPIPEHYISIDVRCKNQLLKTRTITTFPLGSAGEFRLTVPKARGCFKTRQTTTDLQITLKLQQPDLTHQFVLKGAIIAEYAGQSAHY